jgi:integrase
MISTGCATWTEALQWKRAYEAREAKSGRSARRRAPGEVPTFGEVAALYLERPSRLGELSENTVRDKRSFLRPDGPLMRAFADRPVDSITARDLEAWWGREVVDQGRSASHGRNSINTVSVVVKRAMAEGWVDENPVPAFRAMLRDASKTKAGRAEAEARANPIERPEDVARLVEEALAEDLRSGVFVLLLLDTGMRSAEAEALTWGQVAFGSDEDAGSRLVVIDRARVGRDYSAKPKSGRARRVQLSRRLRAALLRLRREQFEPGPEARVLPRFHAGNFRGRQWRRILERARLGHWTPKDLRDTFASHLLTRGINPAYVSRQLGHADWSVTARHYARWTGGDCYVEPERLLPGEVPADLLARFRADPGSRRSQAEALGTARIAS